MIVIKTRYKSANYKGWSFKNLMHWWRLMNAPGNRFKIMYRQSIWIVVTIPANKIKGMRGIMVWPDPVATLYLDQEIALFIMSFKVLRSSNIPFTKWRMFLQLT